MTDFPQFGRLFDWMDKLKTQSAARLVQTNKPAHSIFSCKSPSDVFKSFTFAAPHLNVFFTIGEHLYFFLFKRKNRRRGNSKCNLIKRKKVQYFW